jgi:hypothetical protein
LELVAIACACESLKLREQFEAWQDGTQEFGFGEACTRLNGAQSLQKLRNRLTNGWNDSLFDQRKGKTPGGWLRRLYAGLSNYSHSRPGFTSGDLWHSNGPVYDTAAFHLCVEMQIETYAACYLLVRVAKPDLQIKPRVQNLLFSDHSGPGRGIAVETAKELGLV